MNHLYHWVSTACQSNEVVRKWDIISCTDIHNDIITNKARHRRLFSYTCPIAPNAASRLNIPIPRPTRPAHTLQIPVTCYDARAT